MTLALSGLIGGVCGLAASWLIHRMAERRQLIRRRLAPAA